MDTLNISRSTKDEFDVNEVLRLSSKICEDCKTKDCCRMSDPVFLTDLDIKKIKSNL